MVFSYLKNLPGWRTRKKYIAFSVDDFGNVGLDSVSARENLKKSGIPVENSRFGLYDILENEQDLLGLYEVLNSVKDSAGKHAFFNAFTVCANIDFNAMESNGFSAYIYQTLPETFASKPGYEKAWAVWQEGVEKRYLVPEFHGREHLNVHFLEAGLREKNKNLLTVLQQRSWAGLGYRGRVGYTEAFSFNDFQEVEQHHEIIREGLKVFEKIFGKKAGHFNAPGAREHESLHDTIREGGITMIDADFIKKEHQGKGVYKKRYNPFGSINRYGLSTVFRNCVFEPSLAEKTDWVDSCLREIDIAFRCGKPAHISSHRINFVGGIEPKIRDHGLKELSRLLKVITTKWPDAEFVSLTDIIR